MGRNPPPTQPAEVKANLRKVVTMVQTPVGFFNSGCCLQTTSTTYCLATNKPYMRGGSKQPKAHKTLSSWANFVLRKHIPLPTTAVGIARHVLTYQREDIS